MAKCQRLRWHFLCGIDSKLRPFYYEYSLLGKRPTLARVKTKTSLRCLSRSPFFLHLYTHPL